MADGTLITKNVSSALRPVQPAQAQSCACPVCGGLECLCRPRFFPGQLLTDDDLNRLERYIIEKNKLHNRYLFGWGVVCGLNVVPNPCPGVVTVQSGYALSPCGEDIVLCHDTDVNVCDLINRCRDKRTDWNCEPYTAAPIDCADAVEEWILAVRYDEKPSRGVVPLTGASGGGCCSRCSGDRASHACGCGCSEASNGNGYGKRIDRVPTQCEPTMICEGYTWEVYRGPDSTQAPIARAIEHFNAMATSLLARVPVIQGATVAELKTKVATFQQTLFDFSPGRRDLITQLSTIDLSTATTRPKLTTATGALTRITVQLLRSYLCDALLPPCPPPVNDPRVPLATITITRGDCQVTHICAHGVRQVALTMPTLEHWFGPTLPFGRVQDALAKQCCPTRQVLLPVPAAAVQAADATERAATAASIESPAFGDALQKMVDAAITGKDAEGLANPLEVMVKSSLLDPMVSAAPTIESLTNDVAALKEQVAALTKRQTRPNRK